VCGLVQAKPVQSQTASLGLGPVRPNGWSGPYGSLPQTGSVRTGGIIEHSIPKESVRAVNIPTPVPAMASVSNGSEQSASGPGLDRKNGLVQFQNRPKTRPADSWRAKPGTVPVN
jgi:hypothetical protein